MSHPDGTVSRSEPVAAFAVWHRRLGGEKAAGTSAPHMLQQAGKPAPFRAAYVLTISLLFTLATVPASAETESPAHPAAEKKDQQQGDEPTRAQLEKQFKEALTGATLKGTWRMTGKGGLSANEPLTDPRPETYEISNAVKLAGDHWLITARIRFGDTDVTLPVPVRVLWAGDTPIITVDSWKLPGVGAYSARVMIFGRFYAGVWLSTEKDYGGTLSGRILHDPDHDASRDPQADREGGAPDASPDSK